MADEKINLAEGQYHTIEINYGELTFGSIADATEAYEILNRAVGVKTYYDKRAQVTPANVRMKSVYLWDVDNYCETCSTCLDNCTCEPDDTEEEA